MKKIISVVLCLVLFFSVFDTVAFATSENSQIMPRLNNASAIDSSFIIVDDEAFVTITCLGYNGVTSKIKITTELQKRSFIFFWKDVTEWVDISYEANTFIEHSYSVSSGTYRVKIKYEISGNGGATDVIEEELEYSY